MKLKQALLLLEQCENGLRRLAAEAAAEGDYSGLLRIAQIAKAVGALASEGRLNLAPSVVLESDPTSAGTAVLRVQDKTPERGRKSRSPAETYPRFFRRGDELVKVGWSKKERKEYCHRAAREVIDAAATAVKQSGANGRLFNGDRLLPLKKPASGDAVPSYQVYVVLAWLKHLGVLEQHGSREGYTLSREKQIESTITAAWPQLEEWRGQS